VGKKEGLDFKEVSFNKLKAKNEFAKKKLLRQAQADTSKLGT
jgi:hypothetical protein